MSLEGIFNRWLRAGIQPLVLGGKSFLFDSFLLRKFFLDRYRELHVTVVVEGLNCDLIIGLELLLALLIDLGVINLLLLLISIISLLKVGGQVLLP